MHYLSVNVTYINAREGVMLRKCISVRFRENNCCPRHRDMRQSIRQPLSFVFYKTFGPSAFPTISVTQRSKMIAAPISDQARLSHHHHRIVSFIFGGSGLFLTWPPPSVLTLLLIDSDAHRFWGEARQRARSGGGSVSSVICLTSGLNCR